MAQVHVQVRKLPARVKRFNLHQQLQHGLMALSVLMLIVTGFPIKYGSMGWAEKVVNLFGSFDLMFKVHLTFAVLMLFSGAYHIIWLVGSFATRGPSWRMLPTWKDVTDVIHHLKYLAGLEKSPPPFGRYSWLEKFEYFAVIWGVLFMGASGLILWFPRLFTWLPRWGWDLTRVIHTNEAFVCMLAIFVGHFFAVHLNPKVFPSNSAWYNGTIPLELLAEEHPEEFSRLVREYNLDEDEVRKGLKHKPIANSLALQVIELVVYAAILIWLLVTFIRLLLA